MKKIIVGSFIVAFLGGCTPSDTVVKRGGNNEGLKDWSVEQTFKWKTPKR